MSDSYDEGRQWIGEAVTPASSAAREWLEKELADPKSMIACKWLSRVAEEDGVLDYLVMLLSRYASAERQRVAELEKSMKLWDMVRAQEKQVATDLITEVANQTCGCYAIDDPTWHSSRCVTGKAQAWLRNQSTETKGEKQ